MIFEKFDKIFKFIYFYKEAFCTLKTLKKIKKGGKP